MSNDAGRRRIHGYLEVHGHRVNFSSWDADDRLVKVFRIRTCNAGMECNSSEPGPSSEMSTRIDEAHVLRAKRVDVALEKASLLALAGRESPHLAEQLELHAAQISTRLQEVERHLERRESEFHAQLARWENELRAQRLKAHEREMELLNREQLLQDKQNQVEEQLRNLVAAEAHLERSDGAVCSGEMADEREALSRTMEQWRLRIQDLDQEERRLKTQIEDLARLRQQAWEEQSAAISAREQEQQRLEEERATAKCRIDEEWGRIQREDEELRRRQEAVRRMHHDLSRQSREAIEAQLCAEELRASLGSEVNEAEVAQRIAQIKRKLADQFQLAEQSLRDERAEIERLLLELKQSSGHHAKQRHELQTWFERRQAEIEAQATRLIQKERSLALDEANARHSQQYWESQRQVYESEIRRLKRLIQSS
jgi:hypothetical protein